MSLAFFIPFSLLILHAVCLHHHSQPGRRACGRSIQNNGLVVYHTESFIQPIHQPYITHCQGHRLCSTYRTLYRVAYRQVSRLATAGLSYPDCCPGWRRFYSHNCNQAVCAETCANGGSCVRPNQCACVSGWAGRNCQTDVDECSASKPCSQICHNIAGSFSCGCKEGYTLAEDGHSCQTLQPLSPTETNPDNLHPSISNTGPDADSINVTEEVQLLKNRVELLEEKLHQALAPFNSLFPTSLDQSVAERSSFLTQSFQQLERIDSLSEQIGFLEERLETCSCQDK